MSGTKDNPVIATTMFGYYVPASTYETIIEVVAECERQDQKWGEQNHNASDWLAILAEEFGEVAKETVGIMFAYPWSSNYREELIQTAAVAIRMVESYDRKFTAEDLREAREVAVKNPHSLSDRQIKLLESQKAVLPRGEVKGENTRDDPDDFQVIHARAHHEYAGTDEEIRQYAKRAAQQRVSGS